MHLASVLTCRGFGELALEHSASAREQARSAWVLEQAHLALVLVRMDFAVPEPVRLVWAQEPAHLV